jgi:2-C-methyl-D-erythritol 2,4-cyclodiphosphate synthase
VKVKTGIGIDSHRFETQSTGKLLMLGGLAFEDAPGLEGNSDADVILHALTDAISGVTGRTVIGPVADRLCREGITDSASYLREALTDLAGWQISHVSIALEGSRPKIEPKSEAIRANVARLLGIDLCDVGLTATTGERLSDCGRGLGLFATVIVTVCL